MGGDMRIHLLGIPFKRSLYFSVSEDMIEISIYIFNRNFYYTKFRGWLKNMFGSKSRKGILRHTPLQENTFYIGAW